MPHLLILGFGYSAEAVVAGLDGGWRITATARTPEKAGLLAARGIAPIVFDGTAPSPALAEALRSATHLLVTAAPGTAGDPLLRQHAPDILGAPDLAWIGYLSTIGVYGDRGGAWVSETDPTSAMQARSRERVGAEEAWTALGAARGTPVQLVRLGGIYGPGRNMLVDLKNGTQRRIVKPGQVFNRIHVDDIGSLVRAGMARPDALAVLHGVDGAPAPPQDVVLYACELLGMAPPPETTVEAAGLSPMGLSFWAENKRVANALTCEALGWRPRYPSYREGLSALAATL
jgi:nucleoside-diphosphate-sugar epimerase